MILKLPYRVKIKNAVYVCAMIYVVLYRLYMPNQDEPEQKRFRVQSSTFQVEIRIISVF